MGSIEKRAYDLSPLDEILPPLHASLIYGFPRTTVKQEHIVSILQGGLSRTVKEIPFIAGELRLDEAPGARVGHQVIQIPDPIEEIKIVVNDLTRPSNTYEHTYEELRSAGMPINSLDANVLLPISKNPGLASKVLSSQINFIPGGCLLSVVFAHAAFDAYGSTVILDKWAQHCQELQGLEPAPGMLGKGMIPTRVLPPALGSGIGKVDYEQLKRRAELWHLIGLDSKPEPEAAIFPENTAIQHIFSLSTSAVAEIKRLCEPNTATGDSDKGNWISTNDALVAFFWRNIMRARFPRAGAESATYPPNSLVTVAVDGRSQLSPKISPSYIGNAIFCSMTSLPLKLATEDVSSLADIAFSIRRSVEGNKPLIQDATALAASIPDVTQRRYRIIDLVSENLITSSWTGLPINRLGWGPIFGEAGGAEIFRTPKQQFGGMCSMQPKRLDGTFEVIIGMKAEDMTRLRNDEEFNSFAKLVA